MIFTTGVKPRQATRQATRTMALAFAAAGAVSLYNGSIAHAQTASTPQGRPQRPLALKFGFRFPTNRTLQTEIGDTWFYGGLSYDVAQTRRNAAKTAEARSSVVYQAYLDFTMRKPGTASSGTVYATSGGSSLFDDSDVTGRLLGIGPAIKWVLAPANAHNQPYVGVGVGYYKATVPLFGPLYSYSYNPNVPVVSGSGIVGNYTAARLGGKVFVGNQGKGGWFGELDYTYVGEVIGVRPGGFGARVGHRF